MNHLIDCAACLGVVALLVVCIAARIRLARMMDGGRIMEVEEHDND